MTKKERLALIKSIVSSEEIENQTELCDALKKRGVSVTQATASRDIAELKLIKKEGLKKKACYAENHAEISLTDNALQMLLGLIVSVVPTNNFIVVRTHTGGANTAANILDGAAFSGVLGTIAGDDTILIILSTKSDADALAQSIKELLKKC